MDLKEITIFEGKNFSDVCEEIYRNSLDKRNQIDIVVSELRGLIKGINEAVTIVPMIKDYFDVGVKNDEQLIKMLAVIQRMVDKKQADGGSDSLGLTDEEKNALLKEIDTIHKETEKKTKKLNV